MQKAHAIWSINPFKLAENNAKTERLLSIAQLPRLIQSLANDDGEVNVQFSGFIDADRRKLLKCVLKGSVYLECQTTFQPILVQLDREVVFYPVFKEELIASAPQEYEAFLLQDEELDLISLIEDELILSLPIAISAEEAAESFRFGPEIVEQKADKPNPFSVLAQLKSSSEE